MSLGRSDHFLVISIFRLRRDFGNLEAENLEARADYWRREYGGRCDLANDRENPLLAQDEFLPLEGQKQNEPGW